METLETSLDPPLSHSMTSGLPPLTFLRASYCLSLMHYNQYAEFMQCLGVHKK